MKSASTASCSTQGRLAGRQAGWLAGWLADSKLCAIGASQAPKRIASLGTLALLALVLLFNPASCQPEKQRHAEGAGAEAPGDIVRGRKAAAGLDVNNVER